MVATRTKSDRILQFRDGFIKPATFVLFVCLALPAIIAFGQSAQPTDATVARCFALEVHVRNAAEGATVSAAIRSVLNGRPGITLRVFNHELNEGLDRHRQIAAHYHVATDSYPLLYGCGEALIVPENPEALTQRLDQLLTMTVFVRSGCPHCAQGRDFLRQLAPAYPGLNIVYRDLVSDPSASRDVQALVDRYGKRAVSVPVFHFCNQLIVGFDRSNTTGRQLRQALESWSYACPESAASEEGHDSQDTKAKTAATSHESPDKSVFDFDDAASRDGVAFLASHAGATESAPAADSPESQASDSTDDPPLLPLPPIPTDNVPPLPPVEPEEASGLPLPVSSESSPGDVAADEIDLPLFGPLSANSLGLPLFTLAVGLVDGFNPCAMWVLLFLLSILVNLKDRWKILAVAGSFVVISGVAYFAFMAAWLSVFRFIGLLRPAQITLGLLATVIGIVHIKDFFAFKRGVSFSIPDAAKPTVYSRVRSIVNAEHLLGAIIGAAVLAVLVNIIELLCTAGLPAMYTSILTMQKLPPWQEYAYLGLYNVAYMFDDTVMVAIVVITLSRHKLQEHEGRWLKLVSGAVILALGLIMIARPQWLV